MVDNRNLSLSSKLDREAIEALCDRGFASGFFYRYRCSLSKYSSDENSNALPLSLLPPSGNLIKTTIEQPKPSVKSCKDKEMGPIKLG